MNFHVGKEKCLGHYHEKVLNETPKVYYYKSPIQTHVQNVDNFAQYQHFFDNIIHSFFLIKKVMYSLDIPI